MFYIVFLVLAVVSVCLPLHLMWRVAGLSALSYALAKVIEGPIHWTDQDFGYAIGIAILFLFVCVILAVLLIRLCISAARKTLSRAVLVGPDRPITRGIDITLRLSLGGLVGGLLTMLLGRTASDLPWIRAPDIGIALGAAALALVTALTLKTKAKVTICTAFSTVAVSAALVSFQPTRILAAAEDLADGRPWCLSSSGNTPVITGVGQLSFFSSGQSRTYPHLALIVRDDDARAQFIAHWSIRQQDFRRAVSIHGGVPTCIPRSDFASALQGGTVDPHIYMVGTDTYAIPPNYLPRVFQDRIVIRSPLLVGPDTHLPRVAERVGLTYSDTQLIIPDDALPLSEISDLSDRDSATLMDGQRLTFAGIDDTSGRHVVMTCLSGAFADRDCRMQVHRSGLTYDFQIPVDDIQNWSTATDRIVDLFRQFRP